VGGGSGMERYGAWPGGNLPHIMKKPDIDYYAFARGRTDTDGKFFYQRSNPSTKIFSRYTE